MLLPRALEMPLRDDQRERGEVYCRTQEALQVASPGHPRCARGPVGEVTVHLSGSPAFLQLVPDPPQARRKQLSHGARRRSAGAASGVTGQKQRLVYWQPAHFLRLNNSSLFKSWRYMTLPLLFYQPLTVFAYPLSPFLLLPLLYYSLRSHMVRGLHHLLPKENCNG